MADVEIAMSSSAPGTSLDKRASSLDRIPDAAAVSAPLPIRAATQVRTHGNFHTMNSCLLKNDLKNNRPASKKLPRKLARYVFSSALHLLSSIILTTY